MARKSLWQTKEFWIFYGIEHGYQDRNPKDLKESSDIIDRTWYSRGLRKKWRFEFKKSSSGVLREIALLKTYEKWREYGINHGYDSRSPNSLMYSEEINERAWYSKGKRKKWEFNFNLRYTPTNQEIVQLKTETEWVNYGIMHGYENRRSTTLAKSRIASEKAWYHKGIRNNWNFNFKNKRKVSKSNIEIRSLKSKEEWIEYGIDHCYEKINPKSLERSEDPKDRAWYKKGLRKLWVQEFPFKYCIEKSSDISHLENLLEDYAGGKE